MHLFLLLSALLGHAFLWVALVNRIHGRAMPRLPTQLLTLLCFASLLTAPVAFGGWLLPPAFGRSGGFDWPQIPALAMLYLRVCWVAAVVTVVWWVWRVAQGRML